MAKQSVEALVNGGQATAAPPLGPALGPLGINIGQVIQEINKKTAAFKGMQVPVKIIVESSNKTFEVTVGTPPAYSLIKKEAGLEKGSSNPLTDKVADLRMEQIIKIAKMKEDNLLGKGLKNKIKEIMGTCRSMGIKVEGVDAQEALKLVNAGKFDKKIQEEKTELSAEELRELEVEKKRLAADLEKKKADFEKQAKDIIAQMEGKEASKIRSKLAEANIPKPIIDELVPQEKKIAPGAAAPAGKK